MARGELAGVDEIRDSAGALFAPLGFGFSDDWELIERREFSASSGESFFWPDDTYDEIEISAFGLTVGTDARAVRFRLSTDGSTFVSTANYTWCRWGVNSGGASGAATGTNETSFMGIVLLGTGTDELGGFMGRIFDVSNTTRKKMLMWQHGGRLADGLINSGPYSGQMNASNSSIRGVQVFGDLSATISGTIAIRGRRKTPRALRSQDDWVVITDEENVAAAATHDYFWPDDTYDEIEVTVTGARTGTDNRNLQVRLSSDGSTFHSGATDYRCSFQNWQDNGTGGGDATESTTGAAEFNWLVALGTAADEYLDGVLHITGVSNPSRKTKGWGKGSGIIFNGTQQNMQCSFIDTNTNDRCQGIQLRGASAATMAFDRVRIRGRRKTPAGANASGDWEVLKSGDFAADASGANLDIADIPAAEFPELELTIYDVDTDTTGNSLELRMSADNGATFDTGTNYFERGERHQASATEAENADSQTSGALVNEFGSSNVRLGHGKWTITGLGTTSHPHVYGFGMSINDTANTTFKVTDLLWAGTGSDGLVTAIRLFLAAGGNYTSGRYVLRGRRKA